MPATLSLAGTEQLSGAGNAARPACQQGLQPQQLCMVRLLAHPLLAPGARLAGRAGRSREKPAAMRQGGGRGVGQVQGRAGANRTAFYATASHQRAS